MSQAGIINTASGPVPPAVPTSFVTDVNSPSVPIANVENVVGGTSVANNNNGIRTDGSSGSNTLTIQLTNRQAGSVTTSDATPTSLIVFTAAAAATVYQLEVRIAAFNATDVAGAGYLLEGAIRTDGATVTLITPVDETLSEEANMVASDIDFIASGNTLILQVTGIAAKTIRWNAVLTYVQVT